MTSIVKENTTLLGFICKLNPGISNQKAKNIIKFSEIICDGKKIKAIPSMPLLQGQKVEINKPDDSAKSLHPNKQNPFIIKYEDNNLIVAVKPVGLLTSKESFQKGISFFKVLEKYLSERDKKKTKIYVVHRLDREVEGLVIFAKSEEVKRIFQENWKNVTKKYICITENKPAKEHDFVENWLIETKEQKSVITHQQTYAAKFAKTEYKFLKTIGKYHLLEVKLHTGRKNQIRAHMEFINCPSFIGSKTAYRAQKSNTSSHGIYKLPNCGR